MRRPSHPTFLCLGFALAWTTVCHAQFGRGDSSWATAGADAQRSSWVRNDPKITKDDVQKPEFRFLWKLKIVDKPGPVTALTPALLLTKYIGYRGFRDLAIVQSNGDSMYGIDVDLGRIEWQTHVKPSQEAAATVSNCRSEVIAGLARPTVTAFPGAPFSFGPGRGGPAHSGVGEPNEGAVTLAQAGMFGFRPPPPTPPVAPPGTPVAQTPPGSNAPGAPGSGGAVTAPPRRSPIVIHAISSDGMLHTMYVSNGVEPQPPTEFVPPNSVTRGFIVVNNVAYVALGGCGTGGNGMRAMDLTSKQVTKWDATSEIAGSEGPAFGPDGTLYVATTGGDLVSLDPKTLETKDTYTAKGSFISSPVIFEYRGRVLAAAAAKDGSIHLLDTKSLGGSDHQTPLYKTPPLSGNASFVAGALASWQDTGGRRWILAPMKGQLSADSKFTAGNGPVSSGAIVSWQIQDQNGTLSLVPGWASRGINAPSAPMIINGVVFAASNADPELNTTTAKGSSPAVIYGLDSATGKEIWNSGKTIASSAHRGSLSGGGSQLYLGADDGLLYAFGSWIERQ